MHIPLIFPAITEIKRRQQNLGLSQKQLADLCDIGQSFLARIGRRQAVLSNVIAVKIFEKLADPESKSSKKIPREAKDLRARDIMTSPVYSFVSTDFAEQILNLMLEKNISHLQRPLQTNLGIDWRQALN